MDECGLAGVGRWRDLSFIPIFIFIPFYYTFIPFLLRILLYLSLILFIPFRLLFPVDRRWTSDFRGVVFFILMVGGSEIPVAEIKVSNYMRRTFRREISDREESRWHCC